MTEPRRWNLTPMEREGRRVETIERLAQEKENILRERDDARAVANWLKALLYDVHRNGKCLFADDIPQRDWLIFDHEPETCP